jgi:hypothetical protein
VKNRCGSSSAGSNVNQATGHSSVLT